MNNYGCFNPCVSYTYFEEKNGSGHTRMCIDGRLTSESKCVGYCRYYGHKGYLTKEQRKEHDCLGKGCFYYLQKPSKYYEKHADKNYRRDVLNIASDAASSFEGMRIMSVEELAENKWAIKYITITNEYSIPELERKISNAIGQTARLVKLNYDFDIVSKLLFS